MKTIKGKIENITINRNKIKKNEVKSFELTFNINEVEIGLITETSINVKEGDYVIVAGEDNLNGAFKAYSLKNLN